MNPRIKTIIYITVILIIIVIHTDSNVYAQETDSTKTEVYKLDDGVYASYEEFKTNNPSKKYTPVVLSPDEVTTYLETHTPDKLLFSKGQYIWVGHYTVEGVFNRIPPDSIWGYCIENEVFIKQSEFLVKLNIIGGICQYSNFDALFKDDLNIKKELQYIFEFENGKVKRFKRDNFMRMLSKDMELYQKYLKVDSFKTLKTSMMDYLIEFNDRNPIQFAN